MIVYATPDDLGPWLGIATPATPADAAGLLRSASILVALACYRNPYTDTPTPTEVQPLRDATCAQAAVWVALGLDPAAGGLDSAPVKKSSILGADIERDTTGQAAARAEAATVLAPQARAILTAAGLIYLPVPVGAPTSDPLPSWGQEHSWWERFNPFRNPLSGEYDRPMFP